jgi:RNA polymerase sigma-70 factor (ECF subfamily)
MASKSGLTHPESQEVVQETVLAVSRKIGEFRADPAAGSFKSWLFTLIRWRITDQFRKRARAGELRHHKSAKPDPDEVTTATEERVPDPTNALEALWEDEWRQNVLESALEKLKTQVNPKHYQIFYQLTIKQQPSAAVARTLGVSVAQVYLVRHRLTRLFKQAMKESEGQVR